MNGQKIRQRFKACPIMTKKCGHPGPGTLHFLRGKACHEQYNLLRLPKPEATVDRIQPCHNPVAKLAWFALRNTSTPVKSDMKFPGQGQVHHRAGSYSAFNLVLGENRISPEFTGKLRATASFGFSLPSRQFQDQIPICVFRGLDTPSPFRPRKALNTLFGWFRHELPLPRVLA